MYRIFIVEDDDIIVGALCRHMARWGYEARGASDFRHVAAEFAAYDPQLVLMDITLPFFDGYHWCAELRKLSKVPIIFISSAAENMNILMALSAGADDFVSKPFDLNVLMAKIQALLRRAYDFGGQTALLTHGELIFNALDLTLSFEGKRIELSKNESRILLELMERKGELVSREQLMTRLWETDSFVDENTLTVNVTRLRKKLRDAGVPELILTRKGEGYYIE